MSKKKKTIEDDVKLQDNRYHQIEKDIVRKYDGVRLTWRRVLGEFDWKPWEIIRVSHSDEETIDV